MKITNIKPRKLLPLRLQYEARGNTDRHVADMGASRLGDNISMSTVHQLYKGGVQVNPRDTQNIHYIYKHIQAQYKAQYKYH